MRSAWDALELEPTGEDTFITTIGDEWLMAVVPLGGIVAAVAGAAMRAVVPDERQRLRSLTAVFATPVSAGPVEVRTRVIRAGRSMSQVQVDVTNPGAAAGLTALGVLGGDRRGFSFTESAYPTPDVEPDQVPSFREIPDEHRVADRPTRRLWDEVLDGRPAREVAPWLPYTEDELGVAETKMWVRADDPPVDDAGRLDPGVLVTLGDMMPGSVFRKVGPDSGNWFGPSADYTVHLLGDARPGWLLAHARARHAADGYASTELDLWDPDGEDGPTLVAHATQVMFFAFMPDS